MIIYRQLSFVTSELVSAAKTSSIGIETEPRLIFSRKTAARITSKISSKYFFLFGKSVLWETKISKLIDEITKGKGLFPFEGGLQ